MSDLLLLEWLIIGLVGLELVRPFFKSIRDVSGFVLFPILAFLIVILIFKVHGFRPELIPLGLVSFLFSLARIPQIFALFQRLRFENEGPPSIIALVLGILIVGVSGGIALMFIPKNDSFLTLNSIPIFETEIIQNTDGASELIVRKYRASSTDSKATIVLVPPISGSVEVVDSICSALYEKNYSVITFSKPGLDIPAYDVSGKPVYPSIKTIAKYGLSITAGLFLKTPNEFGRSVEDERLRDLVRVLNSLGNSGPIFIVGYGAGGAAAVRFVAENPDFPIAGLVNIEGPLYSVLEFNEVSEAASGITAVLQRMKPRTVNSIGPVPVLNKPLLLLVSDTISKIESRDGRYATLVRLIHQDKAPALLLAVSGAGPFDYSNVGLQYPLYSALMPGIGNRVHSAGYYIKTTTDLINNFICGIQIEKSNETVPVNGDIYMEYNNYTTLYNPQEVLGK